MWSKTVTFVTCLWLLAAANVQSASEPRETTHEDIRTAIISLGPMFRDNRDKLERHEYREKQLGEQLKNALSAIDKKQTEQSVADKALEAVVKDLEQSMSTLSKSVAEEAADRANAKLMFDSLDEHVAAGAAELKTVLEAEHKSSNQVYHSLDEKLTVVLNEMNALKSRFEALEERQERPKVTNEVIYELLQKALDPATRRGGDSELNATSQLVQETRHEVVEAVKSLSDRLDDGERKREQSDAKLMAAVEATRASQDGWQRSAAESKTLADVEKLLVQTADDVLYTKRRVEYGTHQIVTEVAEAVAGRAKELNESMAAGLQLAVNAVLEAQAAGMANLSVKIENEISQVWRQIGIMYQTLTDSASTLAVLQKQTDAFVNGTVAQTDAMNNKVTAIAGRMTEVDENLNYLLGRLSLVTQEFKEIKIGLGEALESIRVGLQTVQGNKTTADTGPGPNPIDEEPLSENINQNILSKTVYTVS